VNKTGLIILIFGNLIMAGCTVNSTIAPDSFWLDSSRMSRLEHDVQESCDGLVKDINPGSVAVAWVDNLHPNAPLMSEGYIASMYEKTLLRRGFTIKKDEEMAKYRLKLTMTPSRNITLVLAALSYGDGVISSQQSYLRNGSEDWSKALGAYRYRTRTRIVLGSRP
jgi:hypothetical protein